MGFASYHGRPRAADPPPSGGEVFPLAISANQRHLVDGTGAPFFIHGDTAWSICNQLTNAQVDTYLNDCESKGFNTVVVELIERYATSQTPRHLNVDGVAPFNPMSPVDWATPVEAFWDRVDYIIDGCLARGIMVLAFPAYSGFPGTDEGWDDEYNAESDADLQAYGTFLGNRYTQGNIIWVGAGDKSITGTEQTKQLNIFSAIKAVQPTAIYTGHGTTNNDTRNFWSSSYTDIDLVYRWEAYGNFVYEYVRAAYDRAPAKPVFLFEGQYEGSADAAQCRRQAYHSVLSGGCGHCYGHSGLWAFSSPVIDATDWTTQLNATARVQMAYVKALFTAFEWWKLEPRPDTSLVTSSLSEFSTRICPAIASDGTFAMVWTPSNTTLTVNLNALTGIAGNVRARRFNSTTGAYSTIGTYAKSSSQSIVSGGEGVVVFDAA